MATQRPAALQRRQTVLLPMAAAKNNGWLVEKVIDHTREDGRCPVCGDRFGRAERTIDGDGIEGTQYWHTDLVETKRFCVEWCNGATQEVETESVVKAGA